MISWGKPRFAILGTGMSLRTDRISGIVTGAFGIVMVGFASFGLLIVALQRAMLGAMPLPENPQGVSVEDAIRAIHGVWFIYFPLMIAGGFVFAVAGFCVVRGSLVARRVAQLNAICGYAWLIAYAISCYQIMDVIGPPPGTLGAAANSIFLWLSLTVGTLIPAAFPTALLFLLSRPRTADARHSDDQNLLDAGLTS